MGRQANTELNRKAERETDEHREKQIDKTGLKTDGRRDIETAEAEVCRP